MPQRSRLRGRAPTALATAVFLVVLALARYTGAETDAEKLAQIRGVFDRPRLDGFDDPADLLPSWYTTWRVVLQNQIDGVFSALEERAFAPASRVGGGSSPHLEVQDGLGFKIAVVGDSTVRMQANALAWLLKQRTSNDGRLQCFDASETDDTNLVDVRCTGANGGVDDDGKPPRNSSVVMSLQFTKEFNRCMTEDIDADFVYFGCGLHFLQLIPTRRLRAGPLDMWVHYERLLEEAVLFYRSGDGSTGTRVSMGEVFMTTHSFADDRLEGEYLDRVREYSERNVSLLETCRTTVGDLEPLHESWENEYEPEEICTRGCFDNAGVVDLNKRAEAVMTRLGVPVVQGYDATQGQSWATFPEDGRHYPAMIPLELSMFLSEVTTAFRAEKRRIAAGTSHNRDGTVTPQVRLWMAWGAFLVLWSVAIVSAALALQRALGRGAKTTRPL